MKFKQLADSIYYTLSPFFMFYLVTGKEKTALIELGISQLVPQVVYDVEDQFDGRTPDVLIAPHGHFDHGGGCSRWKKELPDAELCVSAPAAAALNDEEQIPLYKRSMKSSSANPFFKNLFPLAEEEPFMEPVAFDCILKEGDTVDLGDVILDVIETPGHSACALSL